MSALMLVNPRKRRTAKQKAATRKLVAFNKRRQRGSVSVPRPRARGRSITRSRTVKTATTRRRNPIRRPRRDIMSRIMTTTQDGAIGSVGAIAGSIVGGYLPLPLNLKTGNMAIAVNALIGMGTGFTVANFFDRKFGEKMAQGAVTVALHGTLKNMISGMLPNVPLSDDLLGDDLLGYYGSMMDMDDDLQAYDMGHYSFDEPDNLGYSGAGMTGEHVESDLDNY